MEPIVEHISFAYFHILIVYYGTQFVKRNFSGRVGG
jgi:hypothetical protein